MCLLSPQFNLPKLIKGQIHVLKSSIEPQDDPYLLRNDRFKLCLSIYYAESCDEFKMVLTNNRSAKNSKCIFGFSGIYESPENEHFIVQSSNTKLPPECGNSNSDSNTINHISVGEEELFWSCYDDDYGETSFWSLKSSLNLKDENTQEFGQNFTNWLAILDEYRKRKSDKSDRRLEDIDKECEPVKNCLVYHCIKPKSVLMEDPQTHKCNKYNIFVISSGITIFILIVFIIIKEKYLWIKL